MLHGTQPSVATSATASRGRRSLLGRWDFRLSTASTSTVSTLLPLYSPVADDDWNSDMQSDKNVMRPPSLSSSPSFPPRYSVIHPIALGPPAAESTRSNHDPEAGVQFQYLYPVKSTKPWATLLLYSRDAVPGNLRPVQRQPKVPRIWGCEPIMGSLELDLDSPLTIQQINIIIKGKITASAFDGGSYKFLDHAVNLWDASNGGSHGLNRRGFEGKLTGSHSFPFYLQFPNEVGPSPEPTPSPVTFTSPFALSKKIGRRRLDTQRSKKQGIPSSPVQRISHPLPSSVASSIPQSFIEKGITATVNYQLSVQFIHGRFKPDSRITTSICYIPASQPHQSSHKRQQAYEAGCLIPGPMNDPDGWFDLPTASVIGTFQSVLGSRQIKIDCQLYVAQPLSYTRGTVIPCFLSLSSNDSEALDSLSNPDVPNVKLIRRLRHFAVAEDEQHAHSSVTYEPHSYLTPTFPTSRRPDNSFVHNTVHHEVAVATWWVSPKDVMQKAHVRHLEGEIHLNPELHPSCSSQVFLIEYFVQMFSLQSADFKQIRSEKSLEPSVIASLPVDITTLYRLDEPLPIPFSEPSETTIRRRVPREDADMVVARGLVSSAFL